MACLPSPSHHHALYIYRLQVVCLPFPVMGGKHDIVLTTVGFRVIPKIRKKKNLLFRSVVKAMVNTILRTSKKLVNVIMYLQAMVSVVHHQLLISDIIFCVSMVNHLDAYLLFAQLRYPQSQTSSQKQWYGNLGDLGFHINSPLEPQRTRNRLIVVSQVPAICYIRILGHIIVKQLQLFIMTIFLKAVWVPGS